MKCRCKLGPTCKTIWFQALLGACLLQFIGCSDPPEFRLNKVEVLKQESIAGLEPGKHFDQQHLDDVAEILTAMFGTPQDPHFPAVGEDYSPIKSVANLKMAAGPVKSDRRGKPSGLYREHCSHCHGISGDGAGPTSSFLNPYPRDFRLGKFKFKSTPIGKPPTDEDLRSVLVNGIPGTAMPSFRALDDEELDALVDYVKYLSIRGQVERRLIKEIPTLEEEFPRLIDIDLKSPTEEGEEDQQLTEDDELFLEQLDLILEKLDEESGRWLDSDDNVTEIPAPPEAFDPKHPGYKEFVELGRTLYHGKANCVQCHGDTGVGDGQTTDYDDWTNDWLKGANVDPEDPESYIRFVEAGAFPPRNLIPRNLRIGAYRGGSKPSDLYLRTVNGIEGTPMPATTALNENELWAVVAYVQQLPFEHQHQPGN